MNWEQLQGQMAQVGGKLKEKWAKLTDDDLLLLKGKKEVFLGKLQERTGLAKEDAEKQLDAFITQIDPSTIDPSKIDPAKVDAPKYGAQAKPSVSK